jgi:hypothetical protein
MFVRFTGGGIGHQNTALATRSFREALLKLFGLTFNDQDLNDPEDGDNPEDSSDAPPVEDEESEDSDIQSDIDDSDDVDTDFEDDGGECGADEEDELGFGRF